MVNCKAIKSTQMKKAIGLSNTSYDNTRELVKNRVQGYSKAGSGSF